MIIFKAHFKNVDPVCTRNSITINFALKPDLQIFPFSVKAQAADILGFVGPMVSFSTTHLCLNPTITEGKAATDNT